MTGQSCSKSGDGNQESNRCRRRRIMPHGLLGAAAVGLLIAGAATLGTGIPDDVVKIASGAGMLAVSLVLILIGVYLACRYKNQSCGDKGGCETDNSNAVKSDNHRNSAENP